jgi:glycerol-3-phosphate acyltransferase PlsX
MERDRMTDQVRIALDAMGGDFGPSAIVPGAAQALRARPDSRFLFFGREDEIHAQLARHPELAPVSEVRHADVSIRMDEKPSQALRNGRRVSSMWMALDAVKKGEADVAVSAGNTGALMAMAKFCVRTMPQIDRPAIAAMWPTTRGASIVLDVGASIGADAQHLVDLSIMGAAMASIILDIERPSVGLLNVGVEEVKGLEEIKAAGRMLREADLPTLEYRGFVEGTDIGKGTVDVVVTEGFAGNIALKTAEGTAKQIASYMREAMGASLMSKIGYLFARGAFAALRDKLDPRKVNGGVFLGLDGVVIKSHGGADAVGFAGAVTIGHDMVRQQLLARIRRSISLTQEARDASISAPAEPAPPFAD